MENLSSVSRYLFLLSLLLPFTSTAAAITRDDFPPGFIFGAGTSAYQVEGAAAEDGRKPSIWDTFAHAGKTIDKSTGDVASDQYHHYKEDVKLMHDTGLDAYRFSISWARLVPDGRGPINPQGLQYYNSLINELLSYGIEPHVTLCHFDLPQALEDEYQGLLSRRIIEDFTAYADLCFREFGDRVKYWITFNEPNIETVGGHDVGVLPPGRCSSPFGVNCSMGDSTTEPYISTHNTLLSHASAAALYKQKYQEEQGGQIGITILGFWFEPLTDSPVDVAATNRMRDFHIGWFMNPLVYGTYPTTMKEIVGSRLPSFTIEESNQLKASFDFLGFNHYCVYYLKGDPNFLDKTERDYIRDVGINISTFYPVKEAAPSQLFGKVPALTRELPPMPSTPWGLQKLLEYLKSNYGNPPVIIHEIGYGEFNIDHTTTSKNDHNDVYRVKYLEEYIESLLVSISNGSNTHGCFLWSFLDCFELAFGYTARYGLYGVDFNDKDRRRYPRLSAKWYSYFLSNGGIRMQVSGRSDTE
ncbi:beta-glucosidase 31-like isoform X1 [Iris pallida]|uniref:Beta-glucosidase 31-like isoform X1 n=1 Tax=Iris pallida TaxID=29817 RepID=A0AAX6GV04_IRIPA|nr:beta-glucosidase 31-like isoform X1 [Iris pallida]